MPRTGLLDRLNEGHQQTLILISAAASYGKRTLAGRWAPTCNCPSSWVSLHESKSNLRMFHTYVVATIRSLFPKMNLQREIHLDADQLPGPSVSAHHLLNDLTGVKEPSSLAPADYHNTRGKLVFDLVMKLLTHPPPAVSLVLEHWLRLLNTSQFFRLRRWQSWLPEDVTASNPLLLLNPAAWG